LGKAFTVIVAVLVLTVALAGLALWRPDVPYSRLEASYARPDSKFVDLPGGVRMHYREVGDPARPAVILIHGYGDSFMTWDRWIPRLSRDFHVYAVDLPGHGLTRAPEGYAPTFDDYVELIDAFAAALRLPPAAVAGNSMGGGVAWLLASRHPQRVSALVLVDASGWPAPTPSKPPPLAFRLLQTPAGVFVLKHFETRAITTEALKANFVDKSLVTPAFVTRWAETHRAPGHRDILMSLRPGPHGRASEAVLARITAPTLVLHGAKDAVIPPDAGRKFATAIPGAQLIVYPGVGHMPQWEAPDRSAADVSDFLKRHAPQPQAKEPA
jgi:pimeloyl-ACP methyl ester carboxylesterase